MENILKKTSRFLSEHKSYALLLPWLLYAIYLVFIATPQYESKSQLIVKSTEGGSSFDPSSLLLSTVSSAGFNTESQLVEAYIQSYDMLEYLDEKLDLRGHYSSANADFASKLDEDHYREEFYEYYLSHISVTVDSMSSLITLQTRAFDQSFAQAINAAIVEKAEEFINTINNDLARSKLEFAQGEHEIVESKLQQAKTELLAFQARYNVLDPTAEGAAFQQIAFTLEATLAQKQAELNTISRVMSDSASEVINLKREIAALESQISAQKLKISMPEENGNPLSVGELMANYSNLQVQLQLAVQAYSSSLITLENARVEAYQKLQHLVTVESPTLPEDNAYPTILYNLTLFGVVLLLTYGIVRIVLATIREL
ncbi:capsule biosynthesis protein [Alteromonas sp. KUL49]|uniref:capsule biosynthesis protein n=1 Tax=Alteromonas sp. KUL49 TaxID=2480798 RepID=UPI00102F26A3|nr:capsule biosynthesis protein [Alteromonas sp. KUL49]TAP35007.1 capsule biosynthesis protein [Alteromonas sp. KUL49]